MSFTILIKLMINLRCVFINWMSHIKIGDRLGEYAAVVNFLFPVTVVLANQNSRLHA